MKQIQSQIIVQLQPQQRYNYQTMQTTTPQTCSSLTSSSQGTHPHPYIDKHKHLHQFQVTHIPNHNQTPSKHAYPHRKTTKRLDYQLASILLYLFVIFACVKPTTANSIFTSISTSNSTVAASSTYSITFNRSLNSLGQAITPSTLESNYIITIVFHTAYPLTSSITTQPSLTNINLNSQTITITLSANITTINVSSIINPLPSGTAFPITLNFYNSSNSGAMIDSGSASLTFQSQTFSPSAITYSFQPGNVTTTSNMTLNIRPWVWDASKMTLYINFMLYWSRSGVNISSTQILSTMSYCNPTCIIKNMGNFFLITVNNLALSSSNILPLTIYNILSPPTLQLADSISLSLGETTYNSNVQTGSLLVAASYPNNLQILQPSSNSMVGEQIVLTLNLASQDLFRSSDSIIINLNTTLSMAATIQINNPLVSSFSSQVSLNQKISISNFVLVTSLSTKFSGVITISNISIQGSTQPITGNIISFHRNGYLYDQSAFSFQANPALISKIVLALGSNSANTITNLTASITLSVGIVSSDYVFIQINQAITVYGCSVVGCSTCICTLTKANPSTGLFYSMIKLSSFTNTSATTQINVVINIKNPITSNYTLLFATTDINNYTKETGSQVFPNITQSTIDSSIFVLDSPVYVVYQVTTFTITLNLTNYTLLNGWMSLSFASALTLPSPTNTYCLVNSNNGLCSLTSSSPIKFNISVSSTTLVYVISINNVRNPQSTQLYSFSISIADLSGISYYNLQSPYYQASVPYPVSTSVISTNCTSSATNIINVTFPYLPFFPNNSVIRDDPSASAINGQYILNRFNYPIILNQTYFTVSITNSFSFQPIYYQMIVYTNDGLYKIFTFNFTLTNCNATSLPITSYSFNGLLEESGSLTFTINQVIFSTILSSSLKAIQYVTVLFPSQFPQSINIVSNVNSSKVGPRLFNLTIGGIQPITLSIWNYTNTISGYFTINTFSQSLGNPNINYLVSTNTNTVFYNVTLLNNCTFPCKRCENNNASKCLSCYSSATTEYYFLDPTQATCIRPQNCSKNTYANYSSNMCVLCNVACLTCVSSTNCTSCASNYYLLNNTCLTDCPSTYYPITPLQLCSSCNSGENVANCLACVTLNKCITCLSSYYLDPVNLVCVTSCKSNQVVVNNTCKTCNSLCTMCSQTVDNCTSCGSGYYLQGNTCVSVCTSPLVPSNTSNVCVSCSTSCLTCAYSPSTCTSCTYPLKLYQSACISNCPNGYFAQNITNTNMQCSTCPSTCTSCSSSTVCLSCSVSYYYYNNTCLYSCPTYTFPTTTINNNMSILICSSCSSNCITCTNSSFCTYCENSYYLSLTGNTTICVSVCGSGRYLNGNTCSSCSSNCLTCASSSICLICATSTSLFNSSCISSCSIGYVRILQTVGSTSTYVCQLCSEIFNNCANCNTLSCTQCQSAYLTNYDSTCVSTCPNGYLNQSNFCVLCSPQCKSCTNSTSNCTSCSANYYFYFNATTNMNQCLIQCPSNMYSSNYTCIGCASPCLTCIITSTTCLTCLSTFFFIPLNNTIQCVTSCPSNSYSYEQKCIYCSTGCAQCNSKGCLNCFASYYSPPPMIINTTNYYQCYENCPSNYPYTTNYTCSTCPQNCNTCNLTDCIQCSTGFSAYGLFCLVQCPPEMQSKSGVCVQKTNTTNPTNFTSNTTAKVSSVSVPIPFSLSAVTLLTCIIVSKLIHSQTIISISFFGLLSVLATICNLFYMITGFTSSSTLALYVVILVIGIIINYINNVLFIFVVKYTLEKDEGFLQWKRGHVRIIRQNKEDMPSHQNLQDHFNIQSEDHNALPEKIETYDCPWRILQVTGTLTSHNIYTVIFSKLFSLSLLNAHVATIKSLQILNYIWICSLLSHLICLVSGCVLAASILITDSQYIKSIYYAVDLIFLNFLFLILGLLLLKKKRELWSRQETKNYPEQQNSTKKVIFQHQNNDFYIGNIVESQQEINGKIANIFNEISDVGDAQLPHSEEKSDTKSQGTVLFFDKIADQNLDQSTEAKRGNNMFFMQINQHDMTPQMFQKDEDIIQIPSSSQLHSVKRHLSLKPQQQMQNLDENVLGGENEETQPNCNSSDTSEKQNISQKGQENSHQLQGLNNSHQKIQNEKVQDVQDGAWMFQQQDGDKQANPINSPSKSHKQKKDLNQQTKKREAQINQIEEIQHLVAEDKDYEGLFFEDDKQQNNRQPNILQVDNAISLGKDEIQELYQNPANLRLQQYQSSTTPIQTLDRREDQKNETKKKRNRRQKIKPQKERYLGNPDQVGNKNKTKLSARISGLEEMFSQYHNNNPYIPKSNQKQEKLSKSPQMKQTKQSRYAYPMQKDRSKQKELRVSSSAHQIRKIQEDEDEESYEAQFQPTETMQANTFNFQSSQKQLFSNSKPKAQGLYKSNNIAKINNRLGTNTIETSERRVVSRDATRLHPRLNSQIGISSVTKNKFKSASKNESSFGDLSGQKRNVWKSRVMSKSRIEDGPKANYNDTAQIIERKTRLANAKAALQSIYLPSK